MKAFSRKEFKTKVTEDANEIYNTKEAYMVKIKGHPLVCMPLPEYKSMMETVHLLGTPANVRALEESMEELKQGKTVKWEEIM